jgi:hypothetical protein
MSRVGTATEGVPMVRHSMQDKPLRSFLVLAGRATRTRFTSAANYREVSGSLKPEPERIGSHVREDDTGYDSKKTTRRTNRV